MAQLPLVLVYHGPLLSHLLGVASHLLSHYGVQVLGIDPPVVDLSLLPRIASTKLQLPFIKAKLLLPINCSPWQPKHGGVVFTTPWELRDLHLFSGIQTGKTREKPGQIAIHEKKNQGFSREKGKDD